jgi:diadenosine tetraphosphatase ApaH/serine/threonine PP2A family protein phosphatase
VRVLLISDIHANLEALNACLEAAPAHDSVANLGDVVGYGASPNEVTEIVRRISSATVRGNHDRACTGLTTLNEFNPVAAFAATWTKDALTPENLSWLRAMPAGPLDLQLGGEHKGGAARADIPLLAHGSPLDEDQYLVTVQDALEVLMRSSIRLTFFGHTHLQGGFILDQESGGHAFRAAYTSRDQAEQATLEFGRNARYLINPGSVGQPRDGDWRAAFALFDSSAGAVTYYRVPYDIVAAQRRIRDAGLPARLATRLAEGR